MEYYTRKITAMTAIKEALEKNPLLKAEDIAFLVLEEYGLSEKFTLQYIKQLKGRGLIWLFSMSKSTQELDYPNLKKLRR